MTSLVRTPSVIPAKAGIYPTDYPEPSQTPLGSPVPTQVLEEPS